MGKSTIDYKGELYYGTSIFNCYNLDVFSSCIGHYCLSSSDFYRIKGQYSFLVATIIASAIIPTFIAGLAFLPRHLIPLQEKFRKVTQPEEGFPEEG